VKKFLFDSAAGLGMRAGVISDQWRNILVKMAMNVAAGRSRFSPNLGLLPFLLSAENMEATDSTFNLGPVSQLNQGNGKKYNMARRFYPRKGGDNSAENMTFCGVTGDSDAYKEDVVTIRYEHISKPLILDDAMLRCLEEGRDEFVNDRLMPHIRTYLETLARKVDKVVVGLAGKHMDGTDVKDLPLFKADGSSYNYVGEIQLDEDKRAALIDELRMVGGSRLSVWAGARSIASANLNGYDASLRPAPMAPYIDDVVSREILLQKGADNGALAIAPGALKFVSFTKFAGDFAYQSDKQERTTIVDPFLGLEHDVLYVTDECGEEVRRSIQLRICFDVVGYPSCWSDDPCFTDVNDVFVYNITCDDGSLCDIVDESCEEVAGEIAEGGDCTPGVLDCVPFAAAFAWECVTQTQYDHNFGLVGPGTYDRIIIGGTPYNFTQSFDRTNATEFGEMVKEISTILTDNELGTVEWAAGATENLTIFAAAGLAIQLSDGVTATTLDEFSGDFLKVENTTAGDPIETAVWQIDGTPYVTGVDALDFIDPVTGDILGTGDRFYLSPPTSTSLVNITFTAIRGGQSSTIVGTAGPCV
jgi:hypothetical protein